MEKGISGSDKEGDAKMTPQTELLDLLVETAEKHCNLGTTISLKELNPGGGIYAELGEGFGNSMYYDKSMEKTIPVLFLCRNKDQKVGLEQLCSICNYLQRLKTYPKGGTFVWLDTEIAKEPNKIGRDEDGVYNFSCILNCKIFY